MPTTNGARRTPNSPDYTVIRHLLVGEDGDLDLYREAKLALQAKWRLERYKICTRCKKEKLQVHFQAAQSRICMDCKSIQIASAQTRKRARQSEWSTETGYRYVKMVVYALKKLGILIPSPCEICGEKKVDAHHKDYNKPWVVNWLCRKDHVEWHRNNEPKRIKN